MVIHKFAAHEGHRQHPRLAEPLVTFANVCTCAFPRRFEPFGHGLARRRGKGDPPFCVKGDTPSDTVSDSVQLIPCKDLQELKCVMVHAWRAPIQFELQRQMQKRCQYIHCSETAGIKQVCTNLKHNRTVFRSQ